jgi:hypothetical protein
MQQRRLADGQELPRKNAKMIWKMKGIAMKRMMLAAVCILAAAMPGCVPSLQPIATEKDLVFELNLLGTWVEADGKSSFKFQKAAAGKGYEVIATNKEGNASKLEARLVRLGNDLFFDTTVRDLDLKGSFAAFHLLPAHLFTKITLSGDTLSYATLNYNWVEKLGGEKKLAIRHETVKDLIVLTASTTELQQFLREHASDKDAFQTPIELKRKN